MAAVDGRGPGGHGHPFQTGETRDEKGLTDASRVRGDER
jgi:hypothetical protein